MTDDEDRIQRIEDDVDELAEFVVESTRRIRSTQAAFFICLFILSVLLGYVWMTS
jgi:hypothetical protein